MEPQNTDNPLQTPPTPTPDQTPSPSPSPDVFTPAPTPNTVVQPQAPVAPIEPTVPPQAPEVVPASPQPMPNTYAAPDAPQVGSVFNPPGKKRKKFKLFFIVLVVALLGFGGYVFAVYMPNQPENVWKTGLNRSGDTLTELIIKATEEEQLNNLDKSELIVKVDIDAGLMGRYEADLNTKLDPTQTQTTFNISTASESQTQNVALEALTKLADGETFPDVYIKSSGFKEFGLDAFLPGIGNYENKWIAIPSDYIESVFSSGLGEDSAPNSNPSAAEVSEVTRLISETINEYIFTANPDKAVIENREYTGKEEVEGVNSLRYVAGINTENATEFCKAMTENLLNSAEFKKIIGEPSDEDANEYRTSTLESCDEVKDEIDSDFTFDVWIDAKYKLINKMRFYSDDDKSEYVDFGHSYQGGDEVPFYVDFVNSIEGLEEGRFTLTTNLADSTTKGELVISGSDGSGSILSAKASLEYKPYSGELNVVRPEGATDISQVLTELGIDNQVLGASTDQINILSLINAN